MSRLVTNAIRSTAASSDAMTIDSAGKPSFPNGGVGKVLQFVKVTQESVTSWATTSYADISGLTATINGVTSGSKIIVDFNLILGCSHDTHFLFKLFRDSTFLPAFSGASMSLTHYPADFSNAQYLFDAVSLRFVDTHGQSEGSNLVYKLQGANDGSSGYTQYLNRRHYDSTQRGQSLMTLTEVAA